MVLFILLRQFLIRCHFQAHVSVSGWSEHIPPSNVQLSAAGQVRVVVTQKALRESAKMRS
jgi:hypothetical protein